MTRVLKVESEGDPWKNKVKPKIRLVGRWLERWGFPAERQVEVTPIEPGVLQLKLKPLANEQQSATNGSLAEQPARHDRAAYRSFEDCIAAIEHLEQERRNAFSAAWRHHCKREIAELEAYIAEHYPNLRRPTRNETIPRPPRESDHWLGDDSLEPF